MFIKILCNLAMVMSLQASAIHWSIDLNSQTNLVSGSYLSKEVLPRLMKLDNILKTRIGALDAEVDQNFLILMIITGLMVIIQKNEIGMKAVPPTTNWIGCEYRN